MTEEAPKKLSVKPCFASKYPDLLKQWDYKSNSISPYEITVGSSRKIWWICEKGHRWNTTVKNRTKRLSGCPYCSGKHIFKGFNDLGTVHPELLAEWDWEKNTDITPYDIGSMSRKKVYWRCTKNHSWIAIVSHRSRGSGCPYCAGKKAIKGETDLATINPDLSSEWHPTKNGTLTAEMIMAGSGKKVWWKCNNGHEWMAAVYSRNSGKNCPFCKKRMPVNGESDLESVNPKLASELHPSKNGELTAKMLRPNSGRKVWWRCNKGHEWEATVYSRNTRESGCPYCSGRRAIKGETDLVTLNPDLAKEFHATKNGELKAEMMTISSGRKVWWRCRKGHEWKASIAHRNNGEGCPYCAGKAK